LLFLLLEIEQPTHKTDVAAESEVFENAGLWGARNVPLRIDPYLAELLVSRSWPTSSRR